MKTRATSIASLVGGLVLVGAAPAARAQTAAQLQPVAHMASLTPGSIVGVVSDERGEPVVGAMVSALGATSAFVVTDRTGRFEMRTLSPGPYLVRAHLTGYVSSHGQIVDVRASGRSSSLIALRHNGASPPVLTAGLTGTIDAGAGEGDEGTTGTAGSLPGDDRADHSETAWRIRHARRGILKDTVPVEVFDEGGAGTAANPGGFAQGIFGRAFDSSTRVATNFFGATPLSGQFNLFTTSTFDTPQQLFSTDTLSRSVAYVSLGAPAGDHADWSVRGALTQGDISSWIVEGEYVARASERHRYDVGLSFATQRFDGGNPAALQDVAAVSRTAGAVYAYDTFQLAPALAITYGGRYAHYDYLEDRALLSSRVAITLSPTEHLRLNALVSERASAPGAEEFLPPADGGILLPPQRTFMPLDPSMPLRAERTLHTEASLERDIATSTITVRVFKQHVADQLVTMFGVSMPNEAASLLGQYFLGNTGDVEATGFGAGFRTAIGEHVHGSVEYTATSASWLPGPDVTYLILFAPSTLGLETQRIHDVTTSVEGEVPRTLTKLMVLYRVSNGFAHPASFAGPAGPAVDARFDVQVRQSLPFMDFSSAKWEMLVAVRNFFHDMSPDQSVYDELLVVRPPKRIVGGLTLHF